MDTCAKIILVDDEVMVTKTLVTLLKLEGFKNVSAFNNPIEALEYLRIYPSDIIISDFIMPKMDGIEFLSKAKKAAQPPFAGAFCRKRAGKIFSKSEKILFSSCKTA